MVPTPDITKGHQSVDVVIPVLNEAHVLADSVSTVRTFLHEHLPYESRVLIVDNPKFSTLIAKMFPSDDEISAPARASARIRTFDEMLATCRNIGVSR